MGNSLLKLLKITTILSSATMIFLQSCNYNEGVGAEIDLTATPSYPEINNLILTSDAKTPQATMLNEDVFSVNIESEVTASRSLNENTNNIIEDLVIGKNLKTGMSLESALSILGIPQSIRIIRGTEPQIDSISIEYLNHGLRIHALTQNSTIEELEVLPEFKGKFIEGAKIGSKVFDLIESFGIPESKNSFIAKYPQRGMYIFLKNETMISVKLFAKNSNLLDHKLLIN
jgi:hypothetical protein